MSTQVQLLPPGPLFLLRLSCGARQQLLKLKVRRIEIVRKAGKGHLYTYTLSLLEPFRVNTWWEHKLSPILATIYATAALSRIPFPSLWPTVTLALLALIVCASYVSVLNDLTDANDDQASGKPSRWPGESRIYPALLLAACVAAGGGFLIIWRKDTLLFYAYLLCWLAFTLYSAPPFRLKVRGIWGVLADASGAHLFPTLFAVVLVYHWNRTEGTAEWIILIALWSFAAGVRGILWHQLEDAVHDRKIGLRTFACLHGTKTVERLGLLTLLLESAAFAAMLWLTRNALAWLFLVLYGLFALIRWRLLGIGLAVVKPGQASRMAMAEYYIVLYPLAYLLTASWQQPSALLLLLFHGVLFSRQGLYLVHEVVAMLRMDKSGAGPKTADEHP
jgi:4-hydroxybenzoate polyprenyltransferase